MYAVLVERNEEESESWYTFIKREGNEAELAKLNQDLESFEWEITEGLSFFVLDNENLVSEKTAKEMTMVDHGCKYYHSKFDGKMKEVRLGLKHTMTNEEKQERVFYVLGHGQISNYLEDEDLEGCILTSSDEKSEEDYEEGLHVQSEEDYEEDLEEKKQEEPAWAR